MIKKFNIASLLCILLGSFCICFISAVTPPLQPFFSREDFHKAVNEARDHYNKYGTTTNDNFEKITTYIDFKNIPNEVELFSIIVQPTYIVVDYRDKNKEINGTLTDALTISWDRSAYDKYYDHIETARTKLTSNPVEINYNNNIMIKEEVYRGDKNIGSQYFWVENGYNIHLVVPVWLLEFYPEVTFFEIQVISVPDDINVDVATPTATPFPSKFDGNGGNNFVSSSTPTPSIEQMPTPKPTQKTNFMLTQTSLLPGTKLSAVKSSHTLILNDVKTIFPSFNIEGYNCLKLRDIAMLLNGTDKQFSVSWNDNTKTIVMTSGQPYTVTGGELEDLFSSTQTAVVTTHKIAVNEKIVEMAAYNVNGYNYFLLRDIAILFNFELSWDSDNKTVMLNLDKEYSE